MKFGVENEVYMKLICFKYKDIHFRSLALFANILIRLS